MRVMKKIVPSIPFSSDLSYEFFLECFCYRCKKHKVDKNGFCAIVEQGGCPIENAMEDARYTYDFPSEDIVRIIEDGETKYWNVCKAFETDDEDLMKSFQALFEDNPTEIGGEV